MAESNPPSIPSLGTLETNSRLLIQAVYNVGQVLRAAFPTAGGSITLSASATTVVPQTAVQADSFIFLMPTNAAAATLMGSARSLYLSAQTTGSSFALTTANGSAAGGTETLNYALMTPV